MSLAVATRLATIAQWRAPPSEPANKATELERLLPWAWKAEQLEAAVEA